MIRRADLADGDAFSWLFVHIAPDGVVVGVLDAAVDGATVGLQVGADEDVVDAEEEAVPVVGDAQPEAGLHEGVGQPFGDGAVGVGDGGGVEVAAHDEPLPTLRGYQAGDGVCLVGADGGGFRQLAQQEARPLLDVGALG